MDPAYHIPLSDDELKMIGEIAAIQGQIEWILQHHVSMILGVWPTTAQDLLGGSGLGTNAKTWISIVRCKMHSWPTTMATCETAFSEIKLMSAERNDFIHAFYAEKVGPGILYGPYALPKQGEYVAIRTRSGKQKLTTEITAARDRAAVISVALSDILTWLMRDKAEPQPTWPGTP